MTKRLVDNDLIGNSKSTQLQSNRFRITYLKGNYNFNFKFTLETSKLGVFRLSEDRLKRLELMNELSNRGYSSTQITNFLENGNVQNSVNFPDLNMKRESKFRLAIVNSNVPNMVGQLSTILANHKLNIHNLINKSI